MTQIREYEDKRAGMLARQSAWQSQVAGATGFTYGGQGIWWACYNRSYVNGNCGPNDPPGTTRNKSGYYTWDECLDFPVGGHEMSIMAAFWRRLPWHTLSPDGSAIEWHAHAPNGKSTQRPYQKADPSHNVVVAYLPQANGDPHTPEGPPGTPPIGCRPPHGPGNSTNCTGCYGGLVRNISAASGHRASWFNPRTGMYTQISTIPKGLDSFDIPATRPGGAAESWLDWVFLIEPIASADHRVVASPVSSSPTDTDTYTSWVTSVKANGRLRNNEAAVGCSFTATRDMTVTRLCRRPAPASRNIVPIIIFSSVGVRLTNASVDALNAHIDALGFACAKAPTALLKANSSYVLMELSNGCDPYYDDVGTTISVDDGEGAHVRSVYGTPPKVTPGGGGLRHCYGPLNFYFQTH